MGRKLLQVRRWVSGRLSGSDGPRGRADPRNNDDEEDSGGKFVSPSGGCESDSECQLIVRRYRALWSIRSQIVGGPKAKKDCLA